MRHTIVWVITLSSLFTFVSCHKEPPAEVRSTTATSTTYQMSDGLQITPLDVEHNEIGDILGIQMWRFHIVCPSPETAIHYVLELRKRGQPPKEILNSGIWGMDIADCQMIVALNPLGDSLDTVEKVETYLKIGSSSSSGMRDNPMKGLGGLSRGPTAKRQDDESFMLAEFSQGGTVPDPNNIRLFLTLNVAKRDDGPR